VRQDGNATESMLGLLSCVAFESLAAQTEQNEGVGVEIHLEQTDRVAIDFSSRRAVARVVTTRVLRPHARR
jgi:hypothetical protein